MRDLVDELLHANVKAQLFGGEHAPRLGRLIILERIGSGAMGDVFSAHDPRLDRKVAVKIVRPTAAIPADRVLAEARALAKLAHPNVVAIYDAEYLDAFDAPRTDAPRTDAPRTDAPRTDAPRTDAPRTGAPRTDAPDDAGVRRNGDSSDEHDDASARHAGGARRTGGAIARHADDDRHTGGAIARHADDDRHTDSAIAIVMELAPGISLRAWLATDREWRDIARVLREAATGLAAAHAAGLVHRDIKPDNILVGDDRTRVVDFGLAFASAPSATGARMRRDIDDDAASGAGTPTYMAPEVLGGAPATPAADQFSFGVTLFEALYGVRPHTGTSREELRVAALSADTAARTSSDATAPSRGTPPGWLHAIAARALAGDPRERFASMADVAAALGRDRRRHRWIAIAVGAALLAAGASTLITMHARTDAGDPCGGADARLATVWTPVRAGEIRAQLGDAPWVPAAVAALAGKRATWATSYRSVCEATRVRGEQSDTLLDLRVRCLDRALERLDALATQLAAPLDRGARVEAASAIAELPDARACETLVDAGELVLPLDFASRQRASSARHDIARAWAAFSLSRYRDAQAIGARIERDVAGLDAPGVLAELAAVRAAVEARIGIAGTAKPALDAALVAASRADAPELETSVWAMRMRQELFAGDPKRVEELLPLARAAAARAHRDGAELDGIMGEALRDEGRLDEARSHLARAWASKDPLRPDQRAVIAMNLGAVHLLAGDPSKAEGAFERALELARGALGTGHPSLALYLDKLAAVDRARGRVREALARNQTSLDMRVAAYGENDRAVATSLLGRARTYLEMGDVDAALADARRAREIRERVFGAHSPRLGEIEAVIGDCHVARGDLEAARKSYALTRELDPRVPLTARIWASRADVELPMLHTADPSFSIARVVQTASVIDWEHGQRNPMFVDSSSPNAVRFDELEEDIGRAPHPLDPAIPYVFAVIAERSGRRTLAQQMIMDTFATLPDEPSRTRLRFARMLWKLEPSNDELHERVLAIEKELPQLTGDRDMPGPD